MESIFDWAKVRGATWDEIDLDAAVWTIPAERMKAGTAHRVPLTPPALALLRRAAEQRQGAHVFPGAKAGKPPNYPNKGSHL